MNINEIKFYSYNGFEEPQLIAIGVKELKRNLQVESNYLGDVTNDTLEEIKYLLDAYDNNIQLMQHYGDNYCNSIWIEPSINNLIAFNRSVLLDEYTYLEDWVA